MSYGPGWAALTAGLPGGSALSAPGLRRAWQCLGALTAHRRGPSGGGGHGALGRGPRGPHPAGGAFPLLRAGPEVLEPVTVPDRSVQQALLRRLALLRGHPWVGDEGVEDAFDACRATAERPHDAGRSTSGGPAASPPAGARGSTRRGEGATLRCVSESPMSLTRMEKVEGMLLAGAVGTLAAWPGEVSWTAAFGTVVGACAALLLGQGLVRDLARLWVNRAASTEKRRIACLCAESTIGLGLVAVALGVTALGIVEPVTLDHRELVLLAAAILAGGFVAKDYVVTVRKETDHGSVIVR